MAHWLAALTHICYRCFPHGVNVAVHHATRKITDVRLADENALAFEPAPRESGAEGAFAAALARDPIATGRSLVRQVRASGQRREHLSLIIEDGNKNLDFESQDQPVIVPNVQLIRDVDTRWDSIYFMIRRLRVLRPVSIQGPE